MNNQIRQIVSVPIRGLFNLTMSYDYDYTTKLQEYVSVPIRGLFNLTNGDYRYYSDIYEYVFPSPSGDYLI